MRAVLLRLPIQGSTGQTKPAGRSRADGWTAPGGFYPNGPTGACCCCCCHVATIFQHTREGRRLSARSNSLAPEKTCIESIRLRCVTTCFHIRLAQHGA